MENIEKKKRVRSPNFPSMPLEKAIEMASSLLSSQQRYPVSIEAAAKDWNISPKSSYLAQYVAAVSAYGLVDIEGENESRKVRVSDLAFKIIIDKRPDSKERKALVKDAALNPDIFRKIYDQYPNGLPSDHALEYCLLADYKFNPASVSDFLSIMKQTFDFANVYKSGIMADKNKSAEVPDMNTREFSPSPSPSPSPSICQSSSVTGEREIATYTIGRGLKARILVSGDQQTTKEAIEKFLTRLAEDKEYLIENINDEKQESGQN